MIKLLTNEEVADFLLECNLIYSNTSHDYSMTWSDLDDLKRNRALSLEAAHWSGVIDSPLIGGQFLVCKDFFFEHVGHSIYRVSKQGWLVRAGMNRCATLDHDQAISLAIKLAEIYSPQVKQEK